MEQVLDNFIAVAVVFLLLSLVVKGIQDILKYAIDNKEKAMREVMDKFMGKDLRLQDILGSLQQLYGQNKAQFLENFTPEQFRGLLDRVDQGGLKALTTTFTFSDVDKAKEFTAQQFGNALKEFQALYEKNMARSVFLLSLLLVVLFNANIIPIYEEITTNTVTRQGLVGIAEEKYREALAEAEDEGKNFGELVNEKRNEMKQILADAPIVMRGIIWGSWNLYSSDFQQYGLLMPLGLFVSAFLVYLGAPFWHDLLQSLLSAKNLLRRKA